jgi:hypothetical protein
VLLFFPLCAELLDVRGELAGDEGKRDDTRNVHLGTEDVHVELELLTDGLDVLETLLVVRASTADPDLDVVLDKERGDLTEGTDDTLEGGGDVGEVGNTTTDEQNLALGVHGSTEHEVKDGSGVVEGLSLGGGTRVLAVVGKLTGVTSRGNGIGVDDRGTTTSDEGPDTTAAVEDGQLERSTSLGVHLSDVGLLLRHLTSERSGELHGRADIDRDLGVLLVGDVQAESSGRASDGPLGTALELSGLIDLGSQVEEVNISRGGIGVGNDDERVDLKVAGLY